LLLVAGPAFYLAFVASLLPPLVPRLRDLGLPPALAVLALLCMAVDGTQGSPATGLFWVLLGQAARAPWYFMVGLAMLVTLSVARGKDAAGASWSERLPGGLAPVSVLMVGSVLSALCSLLSDFRLWPFPSLAARWMATPLFICALLLIVYLAVFAAREWQVSDRGRGGPQAGLAAICTLVVCAAPLVEAFVEAARLLSPSQGLAIWKTLQPITSFLNLASLWTLLALPLVLALTGREQPGNTEPIGSGLDIAPPGRGGAAVRAVQHGFGRRRPT